MSNDFFDSADWTRLARGTLARAEAINAIVDALVVAFDLVPPIANFKEDRMTYCADSGAANAYVLTPAVYAILSYTTGARFSFKAANANTTASTVNISGVGAVALKRANGDAMIGGEIAAGSIPIISYDGTQFLLQSMHASDAASAATSATAAAASATSASSSASSATSSASSASSSASSAATAATSASTSATTATTQATNAAASAVGAAAAVPAGVATHAALTATHGATGAIVGTTNSQTLTNKTLTSPVINTPTLNGSGGALTLPAGADTLVGRATTDTLTNKTLTSPTINGASHAGATTFAGTNTFSTGASFTGGDVSVSGSAQFDIANGTLILDAVLSPPQIASNQDNYNPSSLNSNVAIRLSSDASRNITGLVPPAAAGFVFIVTNVGSFNVVLKNQSASSSAANRFALGADYTIAPDTGVTLWYDATSSRWRMAGHS